MKITGETIPKSDDRETAARGRYFFAFFTARFLFILPSLPFPCAGRVLFRYLSRGADDSRPAVTPVVSLDSWPAIFVNRLEKARNIGFEKARKEH